SDLVSITGNLALGNNWTLLIGDAGNGDNAVLPTDIFTLFTFTGSLAAPNVTGNIINGVNILGSGLPPSWDLSGATVMFDANSIYLTGLTVTPPVPEPSTALLTLCGLLGLAKRRRRAA